MKDHTTFRVGGLVDCWLCPGGEGFTSFCKELLNRAATAEIPVFVLGGGANIVVSDNGIRGIVLDTGLWSTESFPQMSEEEFVFKSGTVIDKAVELSAAVGFGGLEFLAGMPGTIGGAVWMNARCYGGEIADVLSWAEIICKEQGSYVVKRIFAGQGFGYKLSPFQKMDCLIINAAFKLKKDDKEKLLAVIAKYRKDRQEKGHYLFPCAGSVFKNNHDFGKPTGQLIDELGLKGYKVGGAQIAPFHGNIIINTGNASAKDIRSLVNDVAEKVKTATGFVLEPEIIFAGQW
jgi:UDP-N-acetylmuramate dehydrogenase